MSHFFKTHCNRYNRQPPFIQLNYNSTTDDVDNDSDNEFIIDL